MCQYIASTKLMWLKEGDDNSVEEVMKVAHQFVTEMQVLIPFKPIDSFP